MTNNNKQIKPRVLGEQRGGKWR